MDGYRGPAVERAMKIQEVLLRAASGALTWGQAAEIIGISDRQMRRWRERYAAQGYDGLFDRRRKQPSPKRVPLKTVERVLQLYRERYFDFNVRPTTEVLWTEHKVLVSYSWVKRALLKGQDKVLSIMSWVKRALQTAGLLTRGRRRGPHRQGRVGRPKGGML